MPPYTQIDLLRHGALKTAGLFCAKHNEPLSQQGLQDLENATTAGKWDIIISSPYKRCHSFSQHLAIQKGCEYYTDAAFQEMDFGQWTGIPTQTLWEQKPEYLKQLWSSPENFIAPAGESMQAFTQRVKQGWQCLLRTHKNKKILLITHAGVIRVIFTHTLNISHQSALTFHIEHAHFSRLHYYTDGIYSLRSQGKASI